MGIRRQNDLNRTWITHKEVLLTSNHWATKCLYSTILFIFCTNLKPEIYEPPRDKTNKVSERPANSQISLGIRHVWSVSSLSGWRKLGSLATHWGHSEDWSDWADAQADLSLCWVHIHIVGFVTRRLILALTYSVKTRPPILHSRNQYCVMKKRGLFAMKKRDLKFNKTVKFSLSVANLRNQAMLYGSLDIYLRHTVYLNYLVRKHRLILKSVLKLEKVPISPWQDILNYLVTYSLKTNISVQKFMSVLPYIIVGFLNFVLKNKKQEVLSHWYIRWRRWTGGRVKANLKATDVYQFSPRYTKFWKKRKFWEKFPFFKWFLVSTQRVLIFQKTGFNMMHSTKIPESNQNAGKHIIINTWKHKSY